MDIKIVTDSSCDLPLEYYKKYDIKVIPLYITQDDNIYREDLDISSEEVYTRMKNGENFHTSQISYGEFYNNFLELINKKTPFIHLSFSSGLSGTYETAKLAETNLKKEYPNAEFEVVDTKSTTNGLGLVVYLIAQEIENGASLKELHNKVIQMSKNIEHIYSVPTLEYFYRGGRLKRSEAIIGNILNICPILDLDENGGLQPYEKVRGTKKLKKRVIEIIKERGENLSDQIITIAYADDLKKGEEYKKAIIEMIKPKDVFLVPMSPVIGVHAGPGCINISFFSKW
jgi:DegV family protein with EDD domain